MLNILVSELQCMLFKDIRYIVTTLVLGRRQAKRSKTKAKAEDPGHKRWPLYHMNYEGYEAMYRRLCDDCIVDIGINEEVKRMSSDRGKRRHVENCEVCKKLTQ